MAKIIFGIPSHQGKGAADRVNEAFGQQEFPAKFRFINLGGHDQHYPNHSNLRIPASSDVTSEIITLEILRGVAQDAEQLANAWNLQYYLIISDELDDGSSIQDVIDSIFNPPTPKAKKSKSTDTPNGITEVDTTEVDSGAV